MPSCGLQLHPILLSPFLSCQQDLSICLLLLFPPLLQCYARVRRTQPRELGCIDHTLLCRTKIHTNEALYHVLLMNIWGAWL